MIPPLDRLDSAEARYEALTWSEKRERIQNDYGPPQQSNGPLVPFYDLERDPEYMLSLTEF